jgi:hypothetical protein
VLPDSLPEKINGYVGNISPKQTLILRESIASPQHCHGPHKGWRMMRWQSATRWT